MRHVLMSVLLILFVFPVPGEEDPGMDPAEWSPRLKASYAFGMNIGTVIQQAEFDALTVFAGIEDQPQGEALFTPAQADAVLAWYRNQQSMERLRRSGHPALDELEERLAASEAWLAELVTQEGVRVEPVSGLVYRITEEGGRRPAYTDVVTMDYRALRSDGQEFDASHRGPMTIALDDLIPGWALGMRQVGVGGRVELFIHPWLGYGVEGNMGVMGNAGMIIEVELVSIEDPPVVGAPPEE